MLVVAFVHKMLLLTEFGLPIGLNSWCLFSRKIGCTMQQIDNVSFEESIIEPADLETIVGGATFGLTALTWLKKVFLS